jgi:hypothetical protein
VAAFVATKMPANKPGSLTADEYYAILAFDLKANGVDVKIDPTGRADQAAPSAQRPPRVSETRGDSNRR